MTSVRVVENKISSVRRHLGILSSYRDLSRGELESDVTLRGAVERYLYLTTQAAIDLAEAIIALRGLRKPATMGESFSILLEAGILEADLAARLVKMAGFRNILAHDYERLDYGIIQDVLQNRLADVEQFAELAGKLLG